MSTELQVLNPDVEKVDMFFDREPVMTNWDAIKQQVKNGIITKTTALEKLKTYEPMLESDPREHSHWIDQQKLRFALLHEANKSFEGNSTCECCGLRKADPLYDERDWRVSCINCEELDKQSFDARGRGSCEFLSPAFNPRSNSWGLLYYWNHGSRETPFILWLADFYSTRKEAEKALLPIHYYFEWLDVKYNGMIVHWLSFTRLLPLEDIMRMALPLTPEQFRDHLRSVIAVDMEKEQQMMSYYVHDAMREHERKESD